MNSEEASAANSVAPRPRFATQCTTLILTFCSLGRFLCFYSRFLSGFTSTLLWFSVPGRWARQRKRAFSRSCRGVVCGWGWRHPCKLSHAGGTHQLQASQLPEGSTARCRVFFVLHVNTSDAPIFVPFADLVDVQRLTRANCLTAEFAENLRPELRKKFLECAEEAGVDDQLAL